MLPWRHGSKIVVETRVHVRVHADSVGDDWVARIRVIPEPVQIGRLDMGGVERRESGGEIE